MLFMKDDREIMAGEQINLSNITKNSFLNKGNVSDNITKKSLNNELDIGQTKFSDYLKVNDANSEQELSRIEDNNTAVVIEDIKVDTKPSTTVVKVESGSLTLNKFNDYIKNFSLTKAFSSKGTKFALLVVLLAAVLIMFLNVSNTTQNLNTSSTKKTFNNLEYVSSSAYIDNMEKKLINVLSSIKGAGNVNVMITLENGPELKIATSVDERTNTSTSTSTTTTSVTVVENPIIINQNGTSTPLVLMEIMPKVKGVVVVAEGATNVKTKLELLEAVQSLLNVSSNNIQIFAGI